MISLLFSLLPLVISKSNIQILENSHSLILNQFSGQFGKFDQIVLDTFADPLLNSLDLQLISIPDSDKDTNFFKRISEIIISCTETWLSKVWIPLIDKHPNLQHLENNYPFQITLTDKKLQKRSNGHFSTLVSSMIEKFSNIASKTGCYWMMSKLGGLLIGSVLLGYAIVTLLFVRLYARQSLDYVRSNRTQANETFTDETFTNETSSL